MRRIPPQYATAVSSPPDVVCEIMRSGRECFFSTSASSLASAVALMVLGKLAGLQDDFACDLAFFVNGGPRAVVADGHNGIAPRP